MFFFVNIWYVEKDSYIKCVGREVTQLYTIENLREYFVLYIG